MRCRRAFSRYSHICFHDLKSVSKKDCSRIEDTILNARIARTHGFHCPMMLLSPQRQRKLESRGLTPSLSDRCDHILHIVHHAGSVNEILKYILIAQLDLQCLYVQLHIWRELRICHTELLKRFHHIDH